MKKLLLSISIIFAGLSLNSQCTVGTAPDVTGAYPSQLNNGCINGVYSETVTLVFPPDTTTGGFTIPLDSVIITSVGNVPAGLSTQTEMGTFPFTKIAAGGTNYTKTCVSVNGIPTATINDSIEVFFTIYVTNPFGGGALPFPSSKKVGLTISNIDNTTTLTALTISSNEAGASYRWLDCNNSYAVIPSETSQNYTASSNGSYAVEITKNSCTDTSACVVIATVGVIENDFNNSIKLYPNPTNGIINVALDNAYANITINVTDVTGKSVLKQTYNNAKNLNFNIDNSNGVYFVEVSSATEKAIFKVIKQ